MYTLVHIFKHLYYAFGLVSVYLGLLGFSGVLLHSLIIVIFIEMRACSSVRQCNTSCEWHDKYCDQIT